MSFPAHDPWDDPEPDRNAYGPVPALPGTAVSHYFVGFTCGAIAGVEKWIQPPKTPKNYTKPETIQAHQTATMEKMAYEAGMMPIVGEIHSAVLLDIHGVKWAEFQGHPNGHLVGGAVNALAACEFGMKLLSFTRDPNKPGVIWGFHVHDLLRILAFQAVRVRPDLLKPQGITSWWENQWLQDPRRRLLKASTFNAIGIEGLARNVGLVMDYTSAATRAESIRQLCIRYTLAY